MKIFDAKDNELMRADRLERDGNDLVIRGKILGTMPMVARLKPDELRAAAKLLDLKTKLFVLTMFFRRNSAPQDKTPRP